jgi:hypothetical protein
MASKVLVKKVKDFDGYFVTSEGEIISKKRDKEIVLKATNTNGYDKISMKHNDGSIKTFQVHRVVALNFLKKPKDRDIVNHIDGNKLNNRLSNLEWTTRSQNAQHYEKKIKPKYVANRKDKKHDDVVTRLSIIKHAQSACTNNPQLFNSIVTAALQGLS